MALPAWFVRLLSVAASGVAPPVQSSAWLARIALVCLLGFMLSATWAVWPDLVVDCGREMHVPAELVAGKSLYRDVWYPYGPLAPLVNALLLRAFGVHLTVLYIIGFVTAVATVLLVHAIALRFMPALPAFAAAAVYGFQLFQPHLMNGILPYSFAATYGGLLALVCTWFLIRFAGGAPASNAAFAAWAAALSLLSKWEFGLACFAVYGVTCLFVSWNRRCWRALAAPAVHGAISAAAAVTLMAAFVGEDSFRHFVDANWMSLPGTHFMRVYGPAWVAKMGLRFSVAENAKLSAYSLATICCWALAAVALCRCPRSLRWWLMAIPAAVLIWIAVTPPSSSPQSYSLLRHLFYPPGMYYLALLLAVAATLASAAGISRFWLEVLPVASMAVALGFRVMNSTSFTGYSIFYSPLQIVCLYTILSAMLRLIQNNCCSGHRRPISHLIVGVQALGAFLLCWQLAYSQLPRRVHPVETSRGKVLETEARARFLNRLVRFVNGMKAKGESVLLLPEITGVYFLTGTSAPSRFYVLTPGVLSPGQITNEYLRDLEQNPPSAIVISNRPTSEYGVDYFGIGYDQEVLAWIESRYEVAGEIGRFERNARAPDGALIYKPRRDVMHETTPQTPPSPPGAASRPRSN